MTDNPGFVAEADLDQMRQTQNGRQPHSNEVNFDKERVNVETAVKAKAPDNSKNELDLIYSIDDTPPWHMCVILGLQHYLTAFGGFLSMPLILARVFCLGPNDVGTAELLSTLIFVSGLITLLQATFGTRLPILQGGTFAFLVPTFAIMNLDKWKCPNFPDYSNATLYNETMTEQLEEYKEEVWHDRIREIQGAIMLSSIFQVVIGGSGILGFILSYIGPLAICPTITLVGMGLFEAAAKQCSGLWWISIATIICVIVFSQLFYKCKIPCYKVDRTAHGDCSCIKFTKFPFFSVFPMLLSICLMWAVCYILTSADVLPAESDKWGHAARTDTRIEVLRKARWFRFPYPFQWGLPTFSAAAVIGMLAGVIAGMIESVGDYYACARLSGAPPPPIHAINRGIMIEGIGCIIAGMWGTGNGTTSYSENIGAIGITKVGSRIVLQTAAFIMLSLGMLGKFGALFVTIPEPVIGGVLMVTFGIITAVGISNLQYVTMNSSRNLIIVGFSIFFGMALPNWMSSNQNAIQTGVPELDQILTVLLSTGMFVGGMTGFVLDNIIPGTEEERGIKAWRKMSDDETEEEIQSALECYDLPWCMGCIHGVKLFKYLPICPTFNYSPSCSCRRSSKSFSKDISFEDVTGRVTVIHM